MRDLKEVVIAYNDDPETELLVTVCVDGEWVDEDADDDGIFYYFRDEKEFERAKDPGNTEFEFYMKEVG